MESDTNSPVPPFHDLERMAMCGCPILRNGVKKKNKKRKKELRKKKNQKNAFTALKKTPHENYFSY